VLAGGASSKAQSRGGHWRTRASSAAPLPAPGVSARGGGVFGKKVMFRRLFTDLDSNHLKVMTLSCSRKK
jgi:hypothetical protein